MSELTAEIKNIWGEAVLESREFRGEETLVISSDSILEIANYLKDKGFAFLVDLCGVDLGVNEEPRFQVVYLVRNMETTQQLRLVVKLPAENPEVVTVSTVWPTANWHEREAYDMYGIIFKDHPYLKRLYLAPDFEGYPLRKDYPVEGYEE